MTEGGRFSMAETVYILALKYVPLVKFRHILFYQIYMYISKKFIDKRHIIRNL